MKNFSLWVYFTIISFVLLTIIKLWSLHIDTNVSFGMRNLEIPKPNIIFHVWQFQGHFSTSQKNEPLNNRSITLGYFDLTLGGHVYRPHHGPIDWTCEALGRGWYEPPNVRVPLIRHIHEGLKGA